MSLTLSFQNEHIVYENEIRCIVRESDFNLSYNPSLLKYGATLTTASVNPLPTATSIFQTILPLTTTCIITTFTLSPFPYPITINYTVNYTNLSSIPFSFTTQIIIPAGQSSFTDTVIIFTGPTAINIVPTINSATYPLYELIDTTVKDFATGSAFQPYVTTIGLYNDNNELLMVAKLGKPIALSSDTDMTFIVRYDT